MSNFEFYTCLLCSATSTLSPSSVSDFSSAESEVDMTWPLPPPPPLSKRPVRDLEFILFFQKKIEFHSGNYSSCAAFFLPDWRGS